MKGLEENLDLATLLGVLVAAGLVIGSILLGGSGSWFINYPSPPTGDSRRVREMSANASRGQSPNIHAGPSFAKGIHNHWKMALNGQLKTRLTIFSSENNF